MKAKRYAVTVQYGAGYHFFRGYHDSLTDADTQAQLIRDTTVAQYNQKTGRRGVRPRVMIWTQVDRPVTLQPEIEILNGSEFMGNPSSREPSVLDESPLKGVE
jgi:hypothetical protein